MRATERSSLCSWQEKDDPGTRDAEMPEDLAGAARVLAGQRIERTQAFSRPGRQVSEIAYRRSDQDEPSVIRASFLTSPRWPFPCPRFAGMSRMTALDALLKPGRIAIVGATPRENAAGRRIIGHAGGPPFRRHRRRRQSPLRRGHGAPLPPDPRGCPGHSRLRGHGGRGHEDRGGHGGRRGRGRQGRGAPGPAGDRRGRRPDTAGRVAAIARDAGMAVCGANCMGLFNTIEDVRLSLSDLPGLDSPGRIGLLSHSGSTWSGLGGNRRSLRFRHRASRRAPNS